MRKIFLFASLLGLSFNCLAGSITFPATITCSSGKCICDSGTCQGKLLPSNGWTITNTVTVDGAYSYQQNVGVSIYAGFVTNAIATYSNSAGHTFALNSPNNVSISGTLQHCSSFKWNDPDPKHHDFIICHAPAQGCIITLD